MFCRKKVNIKWTCVGFAMKACKTAQNNFWEHI